MKITGDPRQISYGRILQIYLRWRMTRTQPNRQGLTAAPGTCSAIFPADAEQARLAKAYVGGWTAGTSSTPRSSRRSSRAYAFFPPRAIAPGPRPGRCT